MGMTWLAWKLVTSLLLWYVRIFGLATVGSPFVGLSSKTKPPPPKKKNLCIWYTLEIYLNHFECAKKSYGWRGKHIYIYICSRLGFTLFYAFSRLKQYKWNVWQRAICDNNIWSMACPSWPSLRMAMLEKKLLAKLVVSWYLGAFQTNLEFGILTKLWWVFGLVNGSMKKCNAEVDDKVTKFEVHWMTSFFSMNWDFWRLDFS